MSELSIITIVKDNPNGLQKTLQSLQGLSSVRPWKWIVVDSSPNLHRAIRSQAPRDSLWLEHPADGIYSALNAGNNAANSDYIWHLHSGDILVSLSHLEAALKILDADSSVDLLYSPMKRIFADGRWYQDKILSSMRASLISGSGPFHPGMLFRKRIFAKLGGFDSSYRIAGDIDFFVRAVDNEVRNISFGNCFVGFDMHGISQTQLKDSHLEYDRAIKKLKGTWEEKVRIRTRQAFHRVRLFWVNPLLQKFGLYSILHRIIESLKHRRAP